MSEYLIIVVSASFFCAIVSALLGDRGVGKTSKTVISLVMLTIVILPVINSLITFSNNLAIPVINSYSEHINVNEDDELRGYREWLAKTTASELAAEIEKSIKNGMGFTVRVECPWHFSGNDVVFDKIQIYAASDERYFDKIKNYVKLHFSLDSECIKEVG